MSDDPYDIYGFDPSERAARSWLWQIDDDGRLMIVARSDAVFTEPNYDGNDGPMAFGEAYAEHYWRPL